MIIITRRFEDEFKFLQTLNFKKLKIILCEFCYFSKKKMAKENTRVLGFNFVKYVFKSFFKYKCVFCCKLVCKNLFTATADHIGVVVR